MFGHTTVCPNIHHHVSTPDGGKRAEMYRVDITADLNDEDHTGYVWTLLDEARDPGQIRPGAIVVAGDEDTAAVCQVVGGGRQYKIGVFCMSLNFKKDGVMLWNPGMRVGRVPSVRYCAGASHRPGGRDCGGHTRGYI